MVNKSLLFFPFWLALAGLLGVPSQTQANVPGGGTNGASVVYTDNGNGTVTLNNGIVAITVTEADASVHTINYTFNNTGLTQTVNLVSGGTYGGELYWTGNPASFGTMSFVESIVTNTTNYVEISLLSTSATNGAMEVHYSMLRGSPGFYTSVILTHRTNDAVVGIVLRPNIYAGSMFNWMSVDAARNRVMEVSGGLSIPVQGAPKEVYLWTNGIYAGRYDDKYKYSADLGGQRAWGWSSVGTGGLNVGIWNVSASVEDYPGGPMERSLMEHIGTTILNVFTGGYYGMSTDNNIQGGETWSKVYGPYFYYCNNVTNTLTGTNAPAQALYGDALAQAAAEATAWPYSWFANTNYVPATNRGTVTGNLVISDSGNPNASAGGLWVGLVQQPSASEDLVYDFQEWCRPYQFWGQTDANGNFTLTNVIAGTNYTLYAFGPGAEGTFLSQYQTSATQTQTGPPLLYNLPATPFAVTVPAAATNSLGTLTWTPARVGATVFEIGYPNRKADKFRHGDDYWVGDIGPSPGSPSPVWSKWLEYPFDFPNGVNYVVGQSRWSTDWNFIEPVTVDSAGNYDAPTTTITFNLATAPTNGALASLYLGFCSDYYSAVVVSVNGVNMASLSNLAASPNPAPSSGFYVTYADSDSNIREGNNGAFSDERLTFSASALKAGANTITITFREISPDYFADHIMYDYLRLELTGYVPPPPASVSAYAGNSGNLVCWPVTPGATSYNLLRSTTTGSGYASITNGVVGPVCGSGSNNAVYLDATAANGTTYYYEVCSVNPTGSSTNSPASAGTTPLASLAATAPPAPANLTVASVAHQTVNLSWNLATNTSFYSVWRSTLVDTGGGSSNTLSTIILNNSVTATNYIDTTPTDGSIYRYFVTATGPGGTSTNSNYAVGVALPAAPASQPVSLVANFVNTTNITLTWNAVSGAVGYVIARATSASGPYTYLQTVTETTYTDYGLSAATIYYYRVAAMNAAAASSSATEAVNSQQPPPATLTAVATNGQITLAWSAATNAASYTLKRGLSLGNETATVVSGYSGTTYTNTGLVNGITYYYVVTASGAGGSSGNSPEASATPQVAGNGIWIGTSGGIWSATTNWNAGSIASGPGNTADFSTLALTGNLTVTLDSARTLSGLKLGDEAAMYDWTLTGTNTLTLGLNPSLNVVNDSATLSLPLAGTNGLSKVGAGTLILSGTTDTFTNGLTVNAGLVTLDYSAGGSPGTNLVAATNALTLGGGGVQMIGTTNGGSQSFNGVTLNAGNAVLAAAPAAGSPLPVLNLGAISENAGGTVEFIGPATTNASGAVAASAVITTTTIPGAAEQLGGMGLGKNGAFATVGLYDWATTNTTTSPYTLVGGSQVAGFYQSAGVTSGGNYDVNSGGVNTIGNAAGANTLRFNQSATLTVNNNSFTFQDCQGILVTPNCGTNNETVSGAALGFERSSGYGSSYGVIWQNDTQDYLTISIVLGAGRQTGQYNGLVQAGPGTVVYSAANTYELGAYLNGGYSMVTAYTGFGQTNNGYTTVSPVRLNGGTVVGAATFTHDQAGLNARPFVLGNNGGGLAAAAGDTMTVDGVVGSAAGAGPLWIGIPAASANGNVPGLLPGSGANTANPAVYATGTVALTGANNYAGGTILDSGTLNFNGLYALGGANYGGLTFKGGTLQYAANFSGTNGSADVTAGGVTLAGNGTIDVNGNAVAYGGSLGNGGNGSLTVKSSVTGGSLTLAGANNYSGSTTITNVTVSANNASGSATGTGNVLVQNGGALAGRGAIGGTVTVGSGGTLSVGNGTDALALGNALVLNSGSTMQLQIAHSPLTNSSVNVAATMTCGGTLIVTNIGSAALANGDSFQLYSAAGFAGSFGTLVLPSLATNLFWNTNLLLSAGTLVVATTASPTIGSLELSGTDLVVSGTGGLGDWTYVVLATTNLAPANWMPVATNQFDGSGNFNLTVTNAATASQIFYRLQVR